jgi:hypothetical protein
VSTPINSPNRSPLKVWICSRYNRGRLAGIWALQRPLSQGEPTSLPGAEGNIAAAQVWGTINSQRAAGLGRKQMATARGDLEVAD